MSNPAVITLANSSSRKGKFKRFVVEDNIGESIHLHIDNMRIDFTIKEFLDFSQMVRESLCELNFLEKYTIENFDEYFLKECSPFLHKLATIKIEEVELSRLQCIVHSNYKSDLNLMTLVPISETPAYKYLKGDTKAFLSYSQFNYFGITNEKRLLETVGSIKNKGYGFNEKYLVLFDGQNIIRDGQHRAAILAHLYGFDFKVKIMRFYFNGDSHLMRINKINLKTSFIWFAKNIYRKYKEYLKR